MSSVIRQSDLGIVQLQAIPSGPPPARRFAPGRWSGLAGSHQFLTSRNRSAFYRLTTADFQDSFQRANIPAIRGKPAHDVSCPHSRGSFILNVTANGNHLV